VTTLADERTKTPKPPRPSMVIAVALELSMLVTFIVHRSIAGVVLWLAYLYFSATWAALFDAYHQE